MTYRFRVSEAASEFSGDYRVFVHFLDSDGQMMFGDDHSPPEPISTWRLGQDVVYERRLFVPLYPYLGEVTVAIGLYSPSGGYRLPLVAEEIDQLAYRVATVEMVASSRSTLVFEDGWYQSETDPEDPRREWRWTSGSANLSFVNPRVDATFYLEVVGRPDLFDGPQSLTVEVDDEVLESVVLASDTPRYHTLSIPAAIFGNSDTVTMSLNVDKTFVPSIVTNGENSDGRELGFRVFYAFLE